MRSSRRGGAARRRWAGQLLCRQRVPRRARFGAVRPSGDERAVGRVGRGGHGSAGAAAERMAVGGLRAWSHRPTASVRCTPRWFRRRQFLAWCQSVGALAVACLLDRHGSGHTGRIQGDGRAVCDLIGVVLEMVQRTAGSAVDADAPLMEAGVDSLGAGAAQPAAARRRRRIAVEHADV